MKPATLTVSPLGWGLASAHTAQPWVQQGAVAALVLLWLSCTAWMRPLLTPDEGRYIGVAFEMLRSGDWLTPTLNGLPFFHKPPLFYWIAAAHLQVFGVTEMAGRMPSVLGAGLGAFALYLFVDRWCNRATAHRVLCVLLVQPLWFVGAQYANLDMLVAGCISATVLALAHAALSFEAQLPYRHTLLWAYFLAASGVLAKGLIGIVLPGLVIGLWLLLRWRWKTLFALLHLPGALLFLMASAPWFVLMELRFPGFLHYFFVVQHFQRFSVGGFNNAMPLWFYPAVLALLSLPCLLWTVRGWGRAATADQGAAQGPAQRAVQGLMLLWPLVIVGFFSLPKSKLVGYILPAIPPLACLMAWGAGAMVTNARRLRGWLSCVALSALLGIGAVLWLALWPSHSLQTMAQVLQAQRLVGEPVYMLHDYFYDLPLYAALDKPVTVVDDWGDPAMKARDNWRKELAEAAEFAAPEAQQRLMRPADFVTALCETNISWVLVDPYVFERYPFLASLPPLASAPGVVLLRIQRADLTACAKTPHGG